MELCTVQAISKHPINQVLSPPIHSHSILLPKSFICLRRIPITRTSALLSRSIYLRNLLPRSTTSEETSGGANQYIAEKRGGAVVLENVKTDKNGFNEIVAIEETKEESPVDEQVTPFDILDRLNIKTACLYAPSGRTNERLDTDGIGSILLYGGGAIVALWLVSAVISAIDSIPLFPKLMEVVGLASTLWFTSRYLLYKKNRDELAAKIEELKGQVIGSEDD